jgi:acyl dehydratase
MFHVRLLRDMMFAIITDPELDLDVLRLVHGEHDVTIHQPLRPWDVANLRARLDEVEQKSKGLVVRGSLLAYVNGVLAVEAKSSFFIRGQMKMPVSTQKTAEPAAPDLGPAPIQVPIQVSADQSYRYATVSLDDNPIHTDPDTAKAAGLPDVILHGLCTMALSGNAVLKALAFSDARKLKRLAVRFSKPVLNGATLTAHIHPEAGGCRFTVTDGNGDAVITNGIAELVG